ncbi:MAG: glutaminyl-peptide cyclotransferase [Polaribacter sp.]
MKNISVLITLIIGSFLITSCNNNYKFKLETSKKVSLNKPVKITFTEKNNKPITKVQFYINGKEITTKGNSFTINSADYGIGKHTIAALAFFDGKTKKINNSFEVLANKAPAIYTYKVINQYPHDTKAYTEGLEYYNGFLYESTGKKGQSSIRKVEIKTGKIVQKIKLDKKYFGEGITIFNNKIYWLTWQAKKGFVYNLETLKQEREFTFQNSKEGWGLTHSNTELIKSDGTNKIWFLDPKTLKEKRSIQVYTNKYALDNLNELELINGKIYANKYQKNALVIIDANSGAVLGVADLTGLKEEMEKTQKLVPQDEVLNGIAYNKENNTFFVTGKNWGKLFEIKLIKNNN